MTSKEPSAILSNLRDSLFKLCDSYIVAGDLSVVLAELLATFKSGSEKDSLKLIPCIMTLLKSTNLLQSNIQDAIRLSRNATFGNSYKSEKLAANNANQKHQDLLMNKRKSIKSLSLHRLENFGGSISSIQKRNSLDIVSTQSSRKKQKDAISSSPMPENGEVYTLWKAFASLKLTRAKCPIFGSQVKPVHDILFERVPRLILALYRTTARAVKRYEMNESCPFLETKV
jgi:hypothetical protein